MSKLSVARAVGGAGPALAALVDPVLDGLQAGHLQPAGAHPSDLLRPDEAACLEHLQVLHHRWQRDRQRAGELADRGRPVAELLHEPAPGRVGQRGEDRVDVTRLVKHRLKYSREALLVNPNRCSRGVTSSGS